MQTFGAGRPGYLLTLSRAELLRQLRRHRRRAAYRGEEARRERVVTEIRKARLTGIRVAVPVEARLSSLPVGVSVEQPDRDALQRGEGGRRAALRARAGADERLGLGAVRDARRRGERRQAVGEEVLSPAKARRLLEAIDTETLAGLRDGRLGQGRALSYSGGSMSSNTKG